MVNRVNVREPEKNPRQLWKAILDLQTMVYGRSSSVTNGRTRFAGEDSLLVQGSALVVGTLRTVGRHIVEGLGILTVMTLFELFGSMRVKGGGDITLDGGKIETGNIRIENGMIYVGDSIVIDSATNSIRVGNNLVIDGASSEIRISDMVITEENGGSLAAPLSIVVNTPLLDLLGGLHVPQAAIFEGGITATGLLPIAQSSLPEGALVGSVFVDNADRFRVVVNG